MKFKTISVLILFISISTGIKSQLIVNQGLNISEMVQSVLIGENISGFNVEFNGISADTSFLNVGYFSSEFSNIPIPEGIVMATGDVLNTIGPNNSGTSYMPGDAPEYNDADLDSVSAGYATNDEAVLEMDFIANGNYISLSYVFSSEEYNEYVCSQFNDAFAIIVSGPGIDGPYTDNGINMALIPDTEIPITINTVNNGYLGSNGFTDNCPDSVYYFGNSAYFIDNENASDTTATQMDGMTIGMLVVAEVQNGETYHIKFCIADVADGALDSGMFLEAGSFKATTYNPVGIDEITSQPEVQIYPNPSTGIVNIQNSSNEKIQEITILDSFGRNVMSYGSQDQINISDLKNGFYFIQIVIEDEIITIRIVKE